MRTASETHDDRGAAAHPLDRGYTLIEMLVAIVLMGSIVLAIVGGMWAVVRASSMNDDRAKVQAILGAAGDSVVNYKHWNCPEVNGAYVEYVQKAAAAVSWPADSVAITEYEYWNPETRDWDPTNTIQGSGCNEGAGLTINKTMQRLTITATSPGSGYSNSIQIVKADIRPKEIRDATAPVVP
jgi:prepilin-type N-terminal cleavage/methylation domain-containing protein